MNAVNVLTLSPINARRPFRKSDFGENRLDAVEEHSEQREDQPDRFDVLDVWTGTAGSFQGYRDDTDDDQDDTDQGEPSRQTLAEQRQRSTSCEVVGRN